MRLALVMAMLPAVAHASDAFEPGAPVTRSTLAADQMVGTVTCKKGQEIGHDAQKRVVFCTTAKPVDVDGIPIKADSYTLFHRNGRVYQTHAREKFERTLADGSKVACHGDLIALEPDGLLEYCTLAARRPGSPAPRVGAGISFHRTGRVAGMTLDTPYTAAGIAFAAGTSVMWDVKGVVIGGYTNLPIVVGSLVIKYDFRLHANGKLKTVTLDKPAKVGGHDFPDFAKLGFRDDGSLESAEYVAKRGFMIHGEPWTDTRHVTFDRTGKITTDRIEHYQAKDSPDSFRRKRKQP